MDELIGINPSRKTLSREKLLEFVREALKQVGEINESYKKFFEGGHENIAIIPEIEEKLDELRLGYESLFVSDGTSLSRIQDLNVKIQEIKNYHEELLGGDQSIQSDIRECHEKITDFYTYLFGDSEENIGQEKKIREAINEILVFHANLNDEGGYSDAIEGARAKIIESYDELYLEREGEKSKFSKLQDGIGEITSFEKKIKDEIAPLIEGKIKKIETIETDISTKQKEVSSLLSNATVKTLAQGYLESMQKYGFTGLKGVDKVSRSGVKSLALPALSAIASWFVSVFNYILFIFPLFIIAAIFVEPQTLKAMLHIDDFSRVGLSGTHYVFYKISVSVPLLWISWLGQRNISQRKRLFEEYNHKRCTSCLPQRRTLMTWVSWLILKIYCLV